VKLAVIIPEIGPMLAPEKVVSESAIGALVPVIDALAVSVAVSVWLPVVLSVALKVPTPLVSVLFAGSTACASLLVKCTVPAYPVTVLFTASRAVTVKLNAVAAVALAGALTVKCVAAPAATLTFADVPVIDALTLSVAASVWLPAVLSVALNVPTPLVSVLFAGSTACPSVLVKCTVPVYPVTVLFVASSAVTVKLNAVPAVALAGALTVKCVAAAALTLTFADVPVIEDVTESVAESVWLPAVLSVALKVPTPLVSVLFAGSTACPSLVVKCTVPA
jgi:hypothetical protein